MSDGIMYDQRDVVLIPFPYSDLSGSKLRPALIISNNTLKSEDKICTLITSKATKEGLLITKNAYELGSLSFRSWVKPYRLFSIDQRIIRKRLCIFGVEFFEEVLRNIYKYIKKE